MKKLVLVLLATFWLLVMTQQCNAQLSQVTLDWTAAGDDSTSGTATALFFFWSPTTPDTTGYAAWLAAGAKTATTPAGITAWINQASNTPGPAPLPGGTASSFTINSSFLANLKYWFMARTCDEVQQCTRSNFAIKIIPTVDVRPPAAILDLRVR